MHQTLSTKHFFHDTGMVRGFARDVQSKRKLPATRHAAVFVVWATLSQARVIEKK
jgi:hypothetical protein